MAHLTLSGEGRFLQRVQRLTRASERAFWKDLRWSNGVHYFWVSESRSLMAHLTLSGEGRFLQRVQRLTRASERAFWKDLARHFVGTFLERLAGFHVSCHGRHNHEAGGSQT